MNRRMQFLRSLVLQPALWQKLIPVVAIISLALSAIHPLTFGTLLETSEGLRHLYQWIGLDHAIRHGDLWPRYAPGLLFGYGLPIFNYTSPLPLYPFEALHLLGFSFVDAMLIGLILYLLLGAAGAYRLGMTWGGPLAGVSTAFAYVYAPYTLYAWLRRGAVSEIAALALLPWVLWSFRQLAIRGLRRDLVQALGLLSLFILTHRAVALYGIALLAVYSVYLWWISPEPPRAFIRLTLALALAVGLTAFFWLPALAETGYAYIGQPPSYGLDSLDPNGDDLSLGEALSPPRTADLTQLNPTMPRSMGWPQIVLGMSGLAFALLPGVQITNRARRGWLILILGLCVGTIIFATWAGSPLWRLDPLLGDDRHLWLLLGPASLLLALLAGTSVSCIAEEIRHPAGQATWVSVSLAAMIVTSLPWTYRLHLPDPPAKTIIDAQNFERSGGWLDTTSEGQFIPRWTTELPDRDRLTGLYAQSEVIPRLQPAPGVTVDAVTWEALYAKLSFKADAATKLVFDWLYFPGWWARLDDQEARPLPTGPQGLIGVEVPAGEHTLEIGFGLTRLRLAALIISGITLGAACAVVVFVRDIWARAIRPESPNPQRGLMGIAVLVGLLIFASKALLIDNLETPIRRARFSEGIESGVDTSVRADFGHQVELLGYDLPKPEVASGREIPLVLYWRLYDGAVGEALSRSVYLLDLAGNIVAGAESSEPGGLLTNQWVPGFYVADRATLSIPPGTPPGSYILMVTVRDLQHESLYLHAFDEAGALQGLAATIGTLEIVRPSHPAQISQLGVDELLNARLIDSLTLIAVNPIPPASEVGQSFPLIWYWEAREQLKTSYAARLLWADGSEMVAAASPEFPLATGYPTDLWRHGDVWKGAHLAYVPGRLEAGEYTIVVELVGPGSDAIGERVILGHMAVNAPVRTFGPLNPQVATEARWTKEIKLLGYDLPQQRVAQGHRLSLTLYWQAEFELRDRLEVSVRLVDRGGKAVIDQVGIPGGGTRPTTSWAPGEIIVSPVDLFIRREIPPGYYRIQVSWQDASTYSTVDLGDGNPYWTLPHTVTVIAAP